MGPEELIGRFTEHLSRMQFDKAKEFAELEKMRTNWADFSSLDEEHWPAFMTVLAQLANLESLYFSFSYMLTKFSFRKENNIRDIYAQMRSELARIETSYQHKPPEIKGLANSLQQIVSEFGRFFLIRSNLVGFYMLLPVKEWRAFEEDSYVTASKLCLSFENVNDGKFHCFALFKKEFELLKLSYWIHQAIQECNAIDALLMLKSSRDLLEDWFCSLDACPATKPSGSFFLSFGSRRRSTVSRLGLLQFLLQFHHVLVAKFTLYFHDTFVPFAPHNEMKHTLSSQVSFLQLFNTFVRKSNVHTICLLLNRIDQDKQFQGFGYHFSSHSSSTATEGDAPQSHDNDEQISTRSRHIAIKNDSIAQSGLSDKYPALLFIPSERRHDHCHYATICSFVQEGFCGNGTNTGGGTGNTTLGGNVSTSNANLAVDSSTSAGNKIRYLYDKNKEQTFFTVHVEANIHLVITFDRRVQEREGAIHSFLGEALNNLRCTKLFQEIKNIGK